MDTRLGESVWVFTLGSHKILVTPDMGEAQAIRSRQDCSGSRLIENPMHTHSAEAHLLSNLVGKQTFAPEADHCPFSPSKWLM